MPAVRLAAIDVGSNSLHMLVADVSPDGRIQVVDRLKEMVRLGHRTFTSGKLDREAAELALRTLKTFERLARARHVERLGAVARFYGNLIGVKYGEPFVVKEAMQIDDIVSLPSRSI